MALRRHILRLLAAVALLAGAAPCVVAVPAADAASPLPPSPADPERPVTDPPLLAAIARAAGARPRAADVEARVGVEVLTAHTAEVGARVGELGGSVVGAIDGELVQASVPAPVVDDLALSAGVTFVRAPRVVNRPVRAPTDVRDEAAGFGVAVGEGTSLTNAAAWQAAGFTGAVKVGIVDYFNLGLWKPLEVGPVPDAAHRFCQDTADDGEDVCSPVHQGPINRHDGFEHGVAVAEVLKDIAPGAELYLATAATATDLVAAIDFFAANGVHIVTRSLGAAYDGPGDGTGPLDSVVDYAAARSINWFNSAGNDAIWGYSRVTVPDDLSATNGYVDFDRGPGVDTLLRISGACVLFDGVRWSDWYLPPAQRSDYSVEVYRPVGDPSGSSENANPASLALLDSADADQSGGAPPLELADAYLCSGNTYGSDGGVMYVRIRRKSSSPVVGPPDVLEVGIAEGYVESGRWQSASSAAKPVVDSANPALIAVGAVDPANGSGSPEPIGPYSSQGPTNDGRIKPDVSAPSCVQNTIYAPACFSGTSSAAPTVAGVAALLLDANVALLGAPLAAAIEHLTIDRPFSAGGAPDGPDNKYGAGQVRLPAPPAGRIGSSSPPPVMSAYHEITPTRIIDTRPASLVGPTVGTRPREGIVDVGIAGGGGTGVPASATAVAVNVTLTGTLAGGYVQAVPYLRAPYGTSSTLNVPGPGATKANFAIVPIGSEGKISVYMVPGGDLIVDVLGYFAPSDAAAAGRFVAIDPVRTLDTRTSDLVPAGWQPHVPADETIVVPPSSVVPPGAAALVLNVTSTGSNGAGFLRAQPTGTPTATSTVNFAGGADAANTVIVPVGAGGTVSVYANTTSHVVVDVTGYITGSTQPVGTTGLFVPVVTGRVADTRVSGTPLAQASTRAFQMTGLPAPLPGVPAPALAGTPGGTVTGVSINLTAVDEVGAGYLSAFAGGAPLPRTSSLNYADGQPVANGALVKVSPSGELAVYANTHTHVVIDVNGYFT